LGKRYVIFVLTCLSTQHDLRIVLLAMAICCIGAFATMRLFAQAMQANGLNKLSWSFLAAIVAGAAVWCTHFVAMLAFQPGASVAYDPVLTMVSLLIAVGGVCIGLTVATIDRPSAMPAVGGALMGLAIAATHYVGMLAYRVDGLMRWRPGFVVASIVLSVTFSTLAMAAARGQLGARYAKGAFAFLMAAILSLHFTGMAAVDVMRLGAAQPILEQGSEALAIVTALVGLLVISAGVLAYATEDRTRRAAGERLAAAALTDAVTGLPNLTAFEAELQARICGPAPGEPLMVVAIALSGFDGLSERYGRRFGELAIRAITERMLKARKHGVFIARDGAEFVAMGPVEQGEDLRARVRRIVVGLSAPLWIDSQELQVDPRIGVARFPGDAREPEELIRRAKLALRRALTDPLEPIELFDEAVDAEAKRRQTLAEDLNGALERDEFELYYQPQVRIIGRRVIGHEALLRWRHPVFGMVSPAEFIPVAERSGLIIKIGEWVLQTACAVAATWPHEWCVAVNLSPLQLRQANLPLVVQEALARSGLPPQRLELELTESLLLEDRPRALAVLLRIRALGVRLALDDFGTGYSSMDVLRHFPFDKIKLDRSFVNDIESNAQALAILHAMLAMGRSLSIPVLVEGVETERQLAILQAEGCNKVQGYLTGRPVPASAIVAGDALEPASRPPPARTTRAVATI
jgi:diguanylate cyclase (GGDEF)-like protein